MLQLTLNNTLSKGVEEIVKSGWKNRVVAVALCVVLWLFTFGSEANNHCLFGNSDTTPVDLNSGINTSNPLRGQVLTGYPDLTGSYSTQNVGLYNGGGQQYLITISGDITELNRQELSLAEGVAIDYRVDLQVDAVFAPFQPDPGWGRWYVQGPIEFTVVWELNPFGASPGWQGQIYRPNTTSLPGEFCFGTVGESGQSCSTSFALQNVSGPDLCHNSAIRETDVRALSPASLELVFRVGNSQNFESALAPLYRRGLPVGEDRFTQGGGAIDIQLGSAETLVLPDGAPEIREANVTLVRQLGAISAQGPGETMAQYVDRIQRQTQRSSAETRLLVAADNGLSSFANLDVLVGASMGAGTPPQLAPVYYSAIVTGGRTLELDLDTVEPDDTVETVFLLCAATNIQPGLVAPTTINIDLQPADGLATKRNLAENLASAAPIGFAPLETGTDGVTDHLDSLEAGTPTDVQLEAVNRAYWAELAVRDAWQYADPLLGTALGAMRALINDMMSEAFGKAKGDTATRADARLQRQVRDKNQLPNLQSDGWPGLNGADHGQLIGRIKDSTPPPLGPTMKKLLDGLKHLVKVGFIELKNLLANAGKGGPPADIFLGGAEAAIKAMLDEVFKGGTTSLKTFRPFIISNAIKSQKANLLDSEADFSASALLAGPPPGEASGDGALRYSLDRMKDWTNADEAAYRAARSTTIGYINSMNGEATATLQNVAWLEFAVFGADVIASSLDVVANIAPQAAVVEKIAKISKLLGNAALFALPLATGYELVLSAENAAYAAFGVLPPNPLSADKLAQPADITTTNGMVDSLTPTFLPLDGALGSLGTALLANDIAAGLEALSTPGTGLGDTTRAFRRESEIFFGQASAGTYSNSSVSKQLSWLLRLEPEIDGALLDISSRARRLFTEALARRFAGPADPWYLARRDQLRKDITRLRSQLGIFQNDVNNGVDEFVFDSQVASYPPVAVLTDIRAVSGSTGLPGLSATGEQFSITATLANASSVALSNFDVVLSSPVEGAHVSIVSNASQNVSSLGANDGDPAAGNDRDTVEWTIEYTGDFNAGDMVPLFFTILQNGAAPADFVANEHFHLIGPDRDAADGDFDGLSLYYELEHGLDPAVDDALLDKDEDGISNIDEQRLETSASLADTDDDGLEDGEEINPGADGLRTDPLVDDTDGDGVKDGADAAPLDPLVSAAPDQPGTSADVGEPVVAVSQNQITLTGELFKPFSATIEVTNAGTGDLNWYAESLVPGLLMLSPEAGKVHRGPGKLHITLPLQYFPTKAIAEAIRVVDASGSVADEQWISVKVGGGELQQYTVTIDIEGDGSVTSADNLVNCPDDCSQTYDMGAVMELTPTAEANWKFLGWEGSPECGTRVAVAGNIECLARFLSTEIIFKDGFEE
jgi:hypothetical protein